MAWIMMMVRSALNSAGSGDVEAPGGGDPIMDFSVDTNSMYVALLADE